MTKVISLGGSLIVPEEVDIEFLKQFKNLITKLSKKDKFIIVCGGGRTCRKYQKAVKELTKPSTLDLDLIGIASTKLNAELVRIIFGSNAHKKVIYNPFKKINFKKILIAAGYKPGASSDYDTVLLAKTYGFKEVINLTNTDYVYDKNPSEYKDAKPLKNISWKQLLEITGTKWISGINVPFDPLASKLGQKLGLKLKVVNGKNLKNVEDCLNGKNFKGTIVE